MSFALWSLGLSPLDNIILSIATQVGVNFHYSSIFKTQGDLNISIYFSLEQGDVVAYQGMSKSFITDRAQKSNNSDLH